MENLFGAFVLGLLFGIIIFFVKFIYNDYLIGKRIKEQDSKMFKMFHPQSEQYAQVLKSETEFIEGMLRMGWTFVNKGK
jgi:hypothetical protein